MLFFCETLLFFVLLTICIHCATYMWIYICITFFNVVQITGFSYAIAHMAFSHSMFVFYVFYRYVYKFSDIYAYVYVHIFKHRGII